MDILTRIRNTTAASLEGVRSDFDDLPTPVYVSRKPKEMIRIVEGADDLRHPNAGRTSANAGMSKSQDWSDKPEIPVVATPTDARSPRQAELMMSLIEQLADLDHATALQADTYTGRMTAAGKWTPGREGNASDWIGRMIAKVRELKGSTPAKAPVVEDFGDVPAGYYALDTDDGIKFYRVTRSDDGRTFVRVQASDEFHLICNRVSKTEIINAILADTRGAMELYGQHIGRCGRCHRTLTDELSRSRGIGPDCWGKM